MSGSTHYKTWAVIVQYWVSPPQVFAFSGDQATIRAAEHEVQLIVDNFKVWLPLASQTLKGHLERRAPEQEAAEKARLKREREVEEQRLRLLRNIRI